MRVRLRRWGLPAVAAVGAIALVAQAPVLLRRVDAFDVERVEVVGTRYLAPHEALEVSGITRASNVFDPDEPWREALLAHPLVAEVRVERDLPGTIVLEVTEIEPIALARTPELRVVDAAARVLPIDPALTEVDLPVLGIASAVADDGRLAVDAAVALVRATDRLRRSLPTLAADLSEVDGTAGGAVRLRLREPEHVEVLLPAGFGSVHLEQLRRTLDDLARRRELRRVRRIDVRFRDQVVVSLTPE